MITIGNEELSLSLNPDVGGSITEIRHMRSGLSVLGRVPWDPQTGPLASFAARDETEWLTRYTGGWPLLFPNGGDACQFGNVFHGFHGEASISPWRAAVAGNVVSLERRFFTVPVVMRRRISLAVDHVLVEEEVEMLGDRPVEVMWGHHSTFGSDLLAGPVEITSGARQATADKSFDPVTNPLLPGGSGALVAMPGKSGQADLAHPSLPLAALLYIDDFDIAWAAIRRLDNAIAVQLTWDGKCFPCAWLWYELKGTFDAPWHGQAMLIGIEPNTTRPAYGLSHAKDSGGRLLHLEPGSHHHAWLRLHVFRPQGPVWSAPP
jgi:galactose mutarotase-like enzyme